MTTHPDVATALAERPYPGRGVLVGRTGDNSLFAAYWLTGRSPASRERILRAADADLQVVGREDAAFDPLRHYRASTTVGQWVVVGNGDHVDQLAGAIWDDVPLDEALEGVDPEPDPPINPPRIVAVIDESDGSVALAAARSAPSGQIDRLVVRAVPQNGWGLLITTYAGEIAAPRTDATPLWVATAATVDAQLEACWGALDPELRAAAAARPLGGDDAWHTRS